MDEETLFAAALKWDDPAKRAAFLLGACGGDEPLRRNVEELLHAHDQAGNFLEKPAISRAAPPTELGLPETPTEIVPKQLGDYRIVREIGRGGMGIVYEAVHVRLGRRVALKVLSRRIGGDRRFLDRFEREGRAAARLSHANIVAAFDLGEDAGVHFLVLEYIAGRNLAEVVRAEGPLPAARAVECAVQAAEALAHAHSQGLVHRDVKPSNLLLADDGTVKLLDLGLVRFDDLLEDRKTATASPDKRSLTESGAIIGTMSYMAPEQATSPSTADARVDIYSLGCTLFYLLTGRPPFAGETSFAILLAHREEAIPALRDAAEGVPTALEAVFRRMAAKRPEDRYASMVEVIEALRAALEIASGRHADRRQTSALVPQAARMPSRRGVYLALAVLFIAAISAGPWFAWPRRQPGAASSNANKEDTQDTRLCALDALQRVDIDPYELQEAGSFDPNAGAPSELVAILGDSRLKHWYYISSLAFSPDGQTLASGSWDSTVCLWDAATGRRRRTLDASDWVGSIALQSSGKLLAAALRSGTIIVWDVATGAEARRFPARRPHPWPVVRFSPDGTILAWGAHTDIQLWDVHGGDVDVLSGAATKIEDLAFSGGGDTLAVAGANGTVQIFDLAKRHVASVCKGDGPAIGSVAYASDGRVAAGDKHGTLYLFDPATGERACQARAGGGAINGMIAGPEPASLLSASHDGLIREWQATSIGTAPAALAVRRTLGPARTPLWCLARSSRQVAAGGLGQAVRLWDWPSGAETVHGAGHAARATSLALSPDGRRLASGGDDFAVGIWDVASARPLRFLGGYTERVIGVAFSPDGQIVSALSIDGKLRHWDLEQNVQRVGPITRTAASAFAATRDGMRFAVGGPDGYVDVWDGSERRPLFTLTSAGPAITGLAFSVDGNWLAAVAGDLDANRQPSLLRMWELATKQEFVLHQNAKGALSAVAFSPDGKTLATTGFYPATAVNVWDTRGALVATLGDHVNAGRSVAFLPDGGRVVSSGGDGALRLWLLRAGASRAFRLGPASGQILQALVSPEGRHIITANGNGTVSVLRIAPNSFTP